MPRKTHKRRKIRVNKTIKSRKPKTIPKRIIQVWKTIGNHSIEPFEKYIKTMKKMNPTFQHLFFKDDEIDTFLKEKYPKYYETYLKLPVFIQKMDFFRYITMYHYGGFYFDLDVMALKPLDHDLLQHDSVFGIDEYIYKDKRPCCSEPRFADFCSKNQFFLLSQYGFAAKPQNKFIKYIIDNIYDNVDKYIRDYDPSADKDESDNYVYRTTGPDFVTHCYVNYKHSDRIHILIYPDEQYFGKYAKHYHVGTWKKRNANTKK